jgi:hypothetical protein
MFTLAMMLARREQFGLAMEPEGVINAGLTLPASIRRYALTMQIIEQKVETLQGAEVAARHRQALRCFELAKQLLGGLGEKIRAAGAERWRTWLLLTEPSSRREGERIVIDAMREGATATHRARPSRRQGQGRQIRPQADPHLTPAERGPQAPRSGRDAAQRRSQLQCQSKHDFTAQRLTQICSLGSSTKNGHAILKKDTPTWSTSPFGSHKRKYADFLSEHLIQALS